MRRCAAVKARAWSRRIPTERGRRAILNLGHTIGHGVEAAAGYGGLLHGEAVAVGLSAALWLSVQLHAGLAPAVLAARGAARSATACRSARRASTPMRCARRCAATRSGCAARHRIVLLEAPGRPVWGVEVPEADVEAAVARAPG